MEQVFLKLFNMSVSAGWVVLAVLVLRFLLKRAPKNLSVILWGAVGFRLACPSSLESAFSLIPSRQTIAPSTLYESKPELTTGIPAVNEVVNPVFSESFAADATASVNPLQIALTVAGYVWVIGMMLMALYGIISYVLLKRKVAASVLLRDNIWLSDHVPTPFILGWIKPRIYLPSEMPESLCEPVIAHERAHLKRGDHWVKLSGFVLLCVYWFHPLVWLAYILLCRDIELACDERVIRDMDTVQKKDYSEALLACGMKTHRIAACPLAFGEVGVKQRIKAVLSYKKPTVWIILIAVVATVGLAVFFLTDSPQGKEELRPPSVSKKITTPDLFDLRNKVPEYFDPAYEEGAEVYVWEENRTIWCGLMHKSDQARSQKDLDSLAAVSLDAMQFILRANWCSGRHIELHLIGEFESVEELAGADLSKEVIKLWIELRLGLTNCSLYGATNLVIYNRSYYPTGETVTEDQLGLCMAENIGITTCIIDPSVITPRYTVYTIKGKDTTYFAVAEITDNMVYNLYQISVPEEDNLKTESVWELEMTGQIPKISSRL